MIAQKRKKEAVVASTSSTEELGLAELAKGLTCRGNVLHEFRCL